MSPDLEASGEQPSPPGIRSLSRDIPIKFLAVAGFLLAGLLPVVLVALLSLNTGKEALRGRALQQLESVRSLKKAQLDRFFQQRTKDALTLASDPYVLQAQQELCAVFRSLGGPAGRFRGLNRGRFVAPDAYLAVHDRYFPFLKQFVRQRGYYDLFLLDAQAGDVCLTVEKESDFGVHTGEWATSLRDVWQDVVGGAATALSDTRLYPPSANAAAQFVAAPIFDSSGTLAGVVAMQIGLEGIGEILSDRTGMGETGETYLVGPDYRMRSDTSLDPENHTVTASFSRSVAESGISTRPAVEALSGREGTVRALNYRHKEALAAYSPLRVGKVTWALVAEIEDQEIEGQIDRAFNRVILIVFGLSIFLVIALGLLLSTFIILEIRKLTLEVRRLSRQVLEGDLTIRGNPAEIGTDFREVVGQLNSLVGSFVTLLDLLPAPLVLVDTQGRIRFANLASARLLKQPRKKLLRQDYLSAFARIGMQMVEDGTGGDTTAGDAMVMDAEAGGRTAGDATRGDATAGKRMGGDRTRGDATAGDTSAGTRMGGDATAGENKPDLPVSRAMRLGGVVHGELLLARSGLESFYYSTAAPLRHADGALIGAIEVLVDQTETRRMATENAALEDQIERIHRLDSLGTLASGIAHDFNNILAYLFAYADIVSGILPPESPALEPLATLVEGIQRASDLVQHILSFSRQARSPSRLLDLSEVVQSTLAVARAALPSGVTLTCDLQPGCMVNADPSQLQQVVLNLFTNAWQAMPEGGDLAIRVSLCESASCVDPAIPERDSWVKLCVSDSGVGIPEELHARIFEPFFSRKAPGEGTGLGLSVVHGIVKKLGGRVTVQSTPGRGAVFGVFLPFSGSGDPDRPGILF